MSSSGRDADLLRLEQEALRDDPVEALLLAPSLGGIVTIRLDRGTVATIGSDSITLKEADGSSVTLTTDGETRLRKDGKRQELSALRVGDEVVVRSRKVDGAFVARGILVPPADAAGTTGG